MRQLMLIFPLLVLNAYGQRVSSFPASNSIHLITPEALEKSGVKNLRSIFKDSRGLMWFGTENGLFRFDGTNVVFSHHVVGDTTSLPDNTINSITENNLGELWIGTNGGVALLNAFNLKCIRFNESNGRLKTNFDNKIMVDGQGIAWTVNVSGLEKYNAATRKFERAWSDTINGQINTTYATAICDYDQERLLIGTFYDIVVFNKKNNTFNRIPIRINDEVIHAPITSLYVDSSRHIWVSTWGNGFFRFDLNSNSTGTWSWKFNSKTSNTDIIHSLVPGEKPGLLWLATNRGLVRIQYSDTSFHSSIPSVNNADGIQSEQMSIRSLLNDENGLMWTGGSLVAQFTMNGPTFQRVVQPSVANCQDFQEIHLSNRKYYFISNWYSETGMLILDSNLQLVNKLSGFSPDQNVSGVAVDKYQRVWVSTLSGVYIFDKHLRLVHKIDQTTRGKDTLSRSKTNGILINQDSVWILCYNHGVDLFDLDFHKLKSFVGKSGGLNEKLAWKIMLDQRGHIWLCGNAAIYRYDASEQIFKNFSPAVEGSLLSPHDFAERPDGSLLIASDRGLIHLDPGSGKFKYILCPLLKIEENVLSVVSDKNGNAWYLTGDHLVFYDFVSRRFSLFGKEDGLDPAKKFSVIRCFEDRLFIPQLGQLMVFDRSIADVRSQPPTILISQVQINDSLVLQKADISNMDLRYNQNRIQLEFAGINYYKADQNRYAYYLEGAEKDWIYSTRNFITYANLPAGKYTFHVKAANHTGQWGEEKSLNILIRPPFWATWWFLGLATLAVTTILVLVIRYIAQRNLRERILVLEKEQAVEKERNRIARDMHDDLGSGLTKIAILSEVAKKQMDTPGKASQQLENISSSSRDLIDNLQDIIWVLNPKNDSLDSLAAYIREYGVKFFDATHIRIAFEYPSKIPSINLSEEVRRNIFLVIKETFTNAAKHAACTEIKVALQGEHNGFQLSITDNGKGFDKTRIRSFANGLENMRKRMEQAGGCYEVNGFPDMGTQTIVSFYDPHTFL